MNNLTMTRNENSVGIGKLKLYKDIFGESPWNEGFICGNCSKILPKTFYGKCECGEVDNFTAFYNNVELRETFKILVGKLGYSEVIASILGQEVGFIWGWSTEMLSLNAEKLKLSSEQELELIRKILEVYPDFDINNFYYFAEIGVKKDFRGYDIAGQIYRNNLESIRNSGIQYILVRTTKKSDVPFKWFVKEGYKEVFSYNDEQDRVILVLKISENENK